MGNSTPGTTGKPIATKKPSTNDGLEFAWHTGYKLADIAFRIMSWVIILGLLRLGLRTIHGLWYTALCVFMQLLLSWTLIFSTLYLWTKNPEELGFLGGWAITAKIGMLIFGAVILAFTTSAFLWLDQLIDGLALLKGGSATVLAPGQAH